MLIYTLKRLFCSLLNVIAKYLNCIDLQGKLYINLHFLIIKFVLVSIETHKPNSAGVWVLLIKYNSITLAGAASCICQGELQGVEDNSNWPEVV